MGFLIAIIVIGIIIASVMQQNKKTEDLQNEYKTHRQKYIDLFKPSKIIKTSNDTSNKPTEILINEENKKFAIIYLDTAEERQNALFKNLISGGFEDSHNYKEMSDNIEKDGNIVQFKEYNFSDLIDYELLESTESKLQGKGLMTTGGALLLGGVGALIGMNAGDRNIKKDKKFIIVNMQINDINTPLISIEFFNIDNQLEMFYNDRLEKARELVAILAFIKSNANKDISNNNENDIFLKIEKLAELKNKNIITENEFLESKAKLLEKLNN